MWRSRRPKEGTQHRVPARLQRGQWTPCQPKGRWHRAAGQLGLSARARAQSVGITEKENVCACPARLMETVSVLLHIKDSSTRFELLLQTAFVSWDSHFSGTQSTCSLKDNLLRSKHLLRSQSWDWSLICCSLTLTHKQPALHNLQKLFFKNTPSFFFLF